MLDKARIIRRLILLISLIISLPVMAQSGLADETIEDARRLDKKACIIIKQTQMLQRLDAFDKAASDNVCSFAVEYAQSEWIKTRLYKTPFHEDIALTLQNMSMLYSLCHAPMAEKYLTSVLMIKEKLYSKVSAQAASAHDALADYYRLHMMAFKKAIHHYREAKRIRVKLYDNQDPGMTENNSRLALTLFYHKGEKDRAESLLSEAVHIREDAIPNKTFPLYRARMDAGIYYAMIANYPLAIDYLTKALNEITPYSEPDEITILSELGFIYLNKNDLPMSLTYAKKAYDTAKMLYAKNRAPLFLNPIDQLIELSRLNGNTQMAGQLETERKKVRQELLTRL